MIYSSDLEKKYACCIISFIFMNRTNEKVKIIHKITGIYPQSAVYNPAQAAPESHSYEKTNSCK